MKKLFFLLGVIVFFSLTVSAQDSASFADYYGKYKFAPGSPVAEVDITWVNNTISISSDMGTASMAKLGTDSFSMDYENGTVLFIRDSATQKVKGLTILVSGMEMKAEKAEPATTGNGFIQIPGKKEDTFSLN